MEQAPRPGALGALIDELERALGEFTGELRTWGESDLDQLQTPGELRTVRDVAEHVLYSAHIYHSLLRRAFGVDERAWSPAPTTCAELCQRLGDVPEEGWELLRDKSDWTDEQLEAVRIHAGWGTDYDLEQLLEHALVHVLRHRRQLERWRAKATLAPYTAMAELYDRLYAFKDYAGEAARLWEIIRQHQPGAASLLDAACGTGRHLEHLQADFRVEGFDASPGQLEQARLRLPGVPLQQADLRSVELGRRFDVVLCLFGSLGYLPTVAELNLGVARLAAHLEPGGLLLVEPWIAPEDWREGQPHALFIDDPQQKIARLNTSARRGRFSVLELHHLVATPAGTRHFVEHHELLLSTRQEQRDAFAAAGLSAEFDATGLNGRGLWIARRPA
jgi:SAM-dependent methyltransferase